MTWETSKSAEDDTRTDEEITGGPDGVRKPFSGKRSVSSATVSSTDIVVT